VHNFFLAKLHAPPTHATTNNATSASVTENNTALIEDDDLPQKQRFPKPRLPPTGKISSPRKRPIREPGPGKGHPRKKIKIMEEKERERERMERMEKVAAERSGDVVMERSVSSSGKGDMGDGSGGGGAGGMISPESLEAQ
jgi:transcriptional activator SPT7